MAVNYMSTKEASKELGISEEAVRSCMRDKSFPVEIGYTWKARHGDQWNYRISRKMFNELMEVLGEEDIT